MLESLNFAFFELFSWYNNVTDERGSKLLRNGAGQDAYRFADSPRSMAARLAQQNELLRRRKAKTIKRDSFYFLQKTLEQRDEERKSHLLSKEATPLPLFHSDGSKRSSILEPAATATGSRRRKKKVLKYADEDGPKPAIHDSSAATDADLIRSSLRTRDDEVEEGGKGAWDAAENSPSHSPSHSPDYRPRNRRTNASETANSVGAATGGVFSPRSAALRSYRDRDANMETETDEDRGRDNQLSVADRVLLRTTQADGTRGEASDGMFSPRHAELRKFQTTPAKDKDGFSAVDGGSP